jgi:hypothetical protein
MANNTISVNVAPINATVVENKEETTMTTTTNGYMGTVIGMAVEDLKKLSLKDLKASAQVIDLKGRSKMNKAELIEALTPYCDPTKKVEIIEKTEVEAILDAMATPVETTVVEERKEEVTEMKKELTPVTIDTVRALAVLAKSYDPFTAYIDNGRQKDSADRANAKIRASWDAICESCGINLWIGNEDWSNASLENAEKALASKLGIELPEVVETKVVENKEETNMVKTTTNVTLTDAQKKANGDKLVYQLCIAWVMQTWYDFTKLDKNGRPSKSGQKLFFVPGKRVDLNKQNVLISQDKRIYAVTGSLIGKLFGKQYNNREVILKAYKKMEKRGYCHLMESTSKDDNGNDIKYYSVHMTFDEFKKASAVCCNEALKDARADYCKFVIENVKASRKTYAKTVKVVSK